MRFSELRNEIQQCAKLGFIDASKHLIDVIFNIHRSDILALITEIGTIPEDIGHDSSEEKLYTKVSDILFARTLKEMNFSVEVLRERADCADIVAQSRYHRYSLVGDAKAFRLSRTAKNAKDFKVTSMDHWRGDSDFSVLTCPYYQYPKVKSQIYKDALDKNVSLFSWEYLYILLKEDVKESQDRNLINLWNQSEIISKDITIGDAKLNFLDKQNNNIAKIIGINNDAFNEYLNDIKNILVNRGNYEINYYKSEINRIKQLSRDDAINELLVSMKIGNKMNTIKRFIEQL